MTPAMGADTVCHIHSGYGEEKWELPHEAEASIFCFGEACKDRGFKCIIKVNV